MKTGDLKKRITIQTSTKSKDVNGQVVLTWADLVSVFANVVSGKFVEAVQADRMQSLVVLDITIRFRTDIDASMRVKYKDVFYPIVGIADKTGTNEFLLLKVVQGQAT